MATPVLGVGYLIANDLLTSAAVNLIEPWVNTTVPGAGIAAGTVLVAQWDPSMYIGAQLLVGLIGGDLEVVTITATNPGVSFSATFANNHAAGEPIFGATFPVRQTTDPLFTQGEMLAYLSPANPDFRVLRIISSASALRL